MGKGEVLLIVDVQNDFCPGGALGVPGGDTIIPLINRYIDLFAARGATIVASRDWHPKMTRHFKEFGGLWPPHCVQESDGAKFRPDMRLPPDCLVFSKGMDPDRDDYSALTGRDERGRPLFAYLLKKGIHDLFVCGLATDYCVRQTALEGMERGLTVTVLVDAVAGVDLTAGDSERALVEVKEAGARLATIEQIE